MDQLREEVIEMKKLDIPPYVSGKATDLLLVRLRVLQYSLQFSLTPFRTC